MASIPAITQSLNTGSILVAFNCTPRYQFQHSLHSNSHSLSFLFAPTSLHRLNVSIKHGIGLFNICTSRLLNRRILCAAAKEGKLTNARELCDYDFTDAAAEVELRIPFPGETIPDADEVIVNLQDTSLVIEVKILGEVKVLLSIDRLYGQIKPAESAWCIDENELVVSLEKNDADVKWPDIMEAWHSLSVGVSALLKGTSVYLVGDSSEISGAVARELALGLKYAPLQTSQLLEQVTKKSLHELVIDEGENSVADAEAVMLESINTNVRVVVATLGGTFGAATRAKNWKNLHAGFTVWLSHSEAKDEASAEEEARMAKQHENQAYAMADVVVKLAGWNSNAARPAAQGCLRALKCLIESDKELPGKKSLYIRMGCRGDWPNIQPPGWNPSEKDAEVVMA